MKALLIIDVQNDFCPGGALAVPDGDSVVPVINRLIPGYDVVVATRDWHPAGHISFASTHGKDVGETAELPGGLQMMWPDHCVQGTLGADFHPRLDTRGVHAVIHKGYEKDVDSYSGFYDNNRSSSTGLAGYLRGLDVTDVAVCGLATDYCVSFTAMDAVKEGFETSVVLEACRGVGVPDGSVEEALNSMRKAGVHV